jgi:hypothetical protein
MAPTGLSFGELVKKRTSSGVSFGEPMKKYASIERTIPEVWKNFHWGCKVLPRLQGFVLIIEEVSFFLTGSPNGTPLGIFKKSPVFFSGSLNDTPDGVLRYSYSSYP